jgi:hypothetical protein
MGIRGGSGGRRGVFRRGAVALALSCLLALASAAVALGRDFDNPASNDTSQQFAVDNVQRHDTPNDPDYDRAEPDDEDGQATTDLYGQDFGYFGFPAAAGRASAIYHDGPNSGMPMITGFNAGGAWKLDRGNPDVTIAILDTGIKWDRSGLRRQIHLNRGELPVPNHNLASPLSDASRVPVCSQFTGAYDANGDGAFNVLDYVCDDRVSVTGGAHGDNGAVDAEDLIAAFSDSTDADNNGFVDDIAGWDFFDNDNDPYDASSYFAAGNHGSGRASEAAESGNDGSGDIGVCPHCQLMPIRVWDTFVSDGNTFGMGMVYATDNGVSVIEGADGSTYHSAFAEQASQYAYDHGVVQTYSGDDLNTGNHNYPANYGHAMLIEGTVPDTVGLGMDAPDNGAQILEGLCTVANQCPGSNVPPATYFRSANTDQYGGKSSISMEGTTGSENTGKASGAAALVVSAAKDANPSVTLRPDETREILEQTAERATQANGAGLGGQDPGANSANASIDQWTTHFGWGRVDLGKAVSLAASSKIPPEAAIDTPDWYAPVTGPSVHVTGLARARFATGGEFHWRLEWGAGETPTGNQWHAFATGDSPNSSVSGTIDLNQVRAAVAANTIPPDSGGPVFSAASPNPYQQEFTVRLVVSGQDIPTLGVDRRVLTAVNDPTLRAGYPKRLGTGGEGPIRYADLNGDNVQELIVPAEDGTVHAYEPNGSELAGWPVHTRLERSAVGHDTAPGFNALEQATPPREPPRGAAVADLDGDGRPEVIDTAGTHLFVWEPDGTERPGFPIEIDPLGDQSQNFCKPGDESQDLHHRKCGFLASPAVARLNGPDQPLDIVATSLDGHLYAWGPGGSLLPGFPVNLVDPGVAPNDQMFAESINEPAIGDLDGDGKDDVVVATNETYNPQGPGPGTLPGGFSQGLSDILGNALGGSSRVYAVHSDGTQHQGGPFLHGWPIKLNGAIQDTLPLIGPGHTPAIVKLGGDPFVVVSTTGSASIGFFAPDGTLDHAVQQASYGPLSDATDRSGVVNLFESSSIGDLTGSGRPSVVKYGLSLTDLANLALPGQNAPYNHLIGAYDAETGDALPAYPRVTDDFQFLSASNIAKVDKTLPTNQVVAGTGLGLLHAYDGLTGLDVSGFPKVTGGWLFAPAALSDDGRIADITREGYLFQWNAPNLPQCQTEWPSFRHDPQQTGNYDKDGTPPGAPTGLKATRSGDSVSLTWKAPGDDWQCGRASKVRIVASDQPINDANAATELLRYDNARDPGQADSRTFSDAELGNAKYAAVLYQDDAGNWGHLRRVALPAPPQPQPCVDQVRGDTGDNTLIGTSGSEVILGFAGDDFLDGRGADDCLFGGSGDDRMHGGDGNDRISGMGGADKLYGDAGNDTLYGRLGPDRLVGGPGRDTFYAGGGEDIVNAADGVAETVDCGARKDVARVDPSDTTIGCERIVFP